MNGRMNELELEHLDSTICVTSCLVACGEIFVSSCGYNYLVQPFRLVSMNHRWRYIYLTQVILAFKVLGLLHTCLPIVFNTNLLKPTGYVIHHQFNIQQLYAQPTLYLCVLYLSKSKQRLVPLTA